MSQDQGKGSYLSSSSGVILRSRGKFWGQVLGRTWSRGYSNPDPHCDQSFFDTSSQATTPPLGPLSWCVSRNQPPAHSSLWGCLRSLSRVHPPGQAAGIPRSICRLSCRGNRAQQMGPRSRLPPEPASRLLAFTALPRSLRAGLVILSPNTVHCSVPASTEHYPDGQGPRRACLPPASSTARSLPEAQGDAQSPRPHSLRTGQGQRRAGNQLSPALGTHISFNQSPSKPDPGPGKAQPILHQWPACHSPQGTCGTHMNHGQYRLSRHLASRVNWSSLGFETKITTSSCMNSGRLSGPLPHV